MIFAVTVRFIFAVAVTIIPGRILRRLATEKMKSLNLKQVFVRYVSHEIRSPLNVVHAGLEILRSELNSATQSAASQVSNSLCELIDDIYSASETAIEILNDLLHYEHMDAGTFNLELSWRPLSGFLKDKLHWAAILAEKNNVDLQIFDSTVATALTNPLSASNSQDYDEENNLSTVPNHSAHQLLDEDCGITQLTVGLNIDVYKVDQVIRNLITNAVKFTPAGGAVTVKISCEILNATNANNIVSRVGVDAVGLLRVEVTDTGAGISPADQHKVFGEFTQFNRNQLQGGGGSGLGLWISRRIVHLHQGSMGFTSEGRGLGSTFFFEVPLYSFNAAASVDKSSNAIESHPSTLPIANEPPQRIRHLRRKSLIGRMQPNAELATLTNNTFKNATISDDDAKNDDIQFDIEEHAEVQIDSDGFGVLSAKGKAIRESMAFSDEPRNFSLHSVTGDLAGFIVSAHQFERSSGSDDSSPLPVMRWENSLLDEFLVAPSRKKSEAAAHNAMTRNASRIHASSQSSRCSFAQGEPPALPLRFLIVFRLVLR